MTTQSNPVICIIPSAETTTEPAEARSSSATQLRKQLCSSDIHSLSPRPRHKEYVLKGNEERNMLRSVQTLAAVVGSRNRYKYSFSVSDMQHVNVGSNDGFVATTQQALSEAQRSRSESTLDSCALFHSLDIASRSLSTWVAIGENSVASELPSPQPLHAEQSLNPADIVKSVTKSSRLSYLKRKVLYYLTFLEKMKRGGCDIKRIEHLGEWRFAEYTGSAAATTTSASSGATSAWKPAALALTTKDIDRDRGKPLSKYERNIMIFDWLFNVSDIS